MASARPTRSTAANAGKERWQAWGWAAAGVLLSLGTSMMLVVVSYVHRDLETAMSGKDHGRSRDPPTATVFRFMKSTEHGDMRARRVWQEPHFTFFQSTWKGGAFPRVESFLGPPKLKRLPPSCLCPCTGKS